MSKKVYIGVGHGGSDPGAVANGLKEKNLTLSIANACAAYLKKHAVQVLQSRTKDEDDTVNQKVAEANKFGADLVVEIHINAGGGDGVEVYHSVQGGTGKKLATNILNAIKAIGQQSRGIKTKVGSSGRDYFGIIRSTAAPAVLVECAFIDSKDVQIIDTEVERVKMGQAIARGVLKTLGIAEIKNTAKSPYKVRIIADVLNVRAGAGASYKVNITVKRNGIYTIIAEKNGWGQLKSGAGWIPLNYTKKV